LIPLARRWSHTECIQISHRFGDISISIEKKEI
jgi:hypothetical protein